MPRKRATLPPERAFPFAACRLPGLPDLSFIAGRCLSVLPELGADIRECGMRGGAAGFNPLPFNGLRGLEGGVAYPIAPPPAPGPATLHTLVRTGQEIGSRPGSNYRYSSSYMRPIGCPDFASDLPDRTI